MSETEAQVSQDASIDPTNDASPPTKTIESTGDDYQAMLSAAKAAKQKESPPVNDNAAPEVANDAAAPTEPEPPKLSLAEKLEARRERKTYEREQRELARQREEFQRQQAEMQRQLEEAQAERKRIEGIKEKGKLQPTKAMRELGWDPAQVMEATAAEAGSDAPLRIHVEELRDYTSKEFEQMRAELRALKAEREQEREQLTAHQRQRVHQEFVAKINAESYPALSMYQPDYILQKGLKLVDDARANDPNFTCDDKEILDYLEEEAKGKLPQALREALSAPKGQAPQGTRAKGPRTLSAASASERRASPKPIEEMTAEEQRAFLIQTAREAKRKAS